MRWLPACGHCGCKVIGHAIEGDGEIFCCAHCVANEDVDGARDRIDN